ncbi:MAG: kelch repeat-containing protein [Flavobacterium sp.]
MIHSKQKDNLAKGKIAALLVVSIITLWGCSKDDDSEDLGNWVTSVTFDGVARSRAASFVIGNKGYVGTGYDGDDYLNDFWEFDINQGYWSQKANFPGVPRSSAVGFAIGSNGYIGTGYDGNLELKDFYKYNPASDTWTPIADFAGDKVRRSAVGFSSDNYAYVGCGYDGVNDKKDFWRYDPGTDSWTELFGFGGNKRRDAVTFRINNTVYLASGISNAANLKDFWGFDLTSETWTKLRDIYENDDDGNTDDYTIIRSSAVGFTLGNYGYVCTGVSYNTTWEYNPATDYWIRKTTFEGANRQDAIALSNGQRAFVALGRAGNVYLDDMYEFKPFDEQQDDD